MVEEVYVVGRDERNRWYWRCLDCGWLGIDCGSETFANQEARSHVAKDHADSGVGGVS